MRSKCCLATLVFKTEGHRVLFIYRQNCPHPGQSDFWVFDAQIEINFQCIYKHTLEYHNVHKFIDEDQRVI